MERSRLLLPIAALAAALIAPTARGQVDGPEVPDVRQRSGLFTRITPIEPRLPVDKDRDLWFNSKWLPRKPINRGHWVNSWKDGGLYGEQLPSGCTSCRTPSFRGMPGNPNVPPECEPHNPVSRVFGNFVHPFKPVDTYYAGGCYAPVYDLDPFVPGPGWFPWWVPDFANCITGD